MKRRFRTALAVSMFALGILAGCNDYNTSVQYNTGATLTNISPSGLPAGPPPATAANCQNANTGPTFPCFTLYVIASANNPFVGTGTLPVVQWNGQKLPTTFIDTTNISAQVPYSYVAKAGSVAVNVYQPQNQGSQYNGLSNALTFIIYGEPNPYPTLSSVSPTSGPYCDNSSNKCTGLPITVAGTNFIPTSQNGGSSVTFTGDATYGQETAITVNSISSTEMKATIPGALFCASGTAEINVINPPSAICLVNCPNLGGGDTNRPPSGQPVTTQTFTITNSTAVNTCPANVPAGTNVVEAAAISQDGRYVVYASDQNGTSQIVLRDTCLGVAAGCVASTRTVSVAPDGTVGNADSRNVAMTSDGRYVAFSSAATNLVANAQPGRQIYVRDTCNGADSSCTASTKLVSTDELGRLAGTVALHPSLSASGRFVAFVAERSSAAGNLTAVDVASATSKMTRQIFVRDTCLGATNCTPAATQLSFVPGNANGLSSGASTILVAEEAPAISRDGRYVTFTASQGGGWQIVRNDNCVGAAKACVPSSQTISVSPDGIVGNAASHNPVMTPDGRYISFSSAASNLIDSAPLGRQVYLRDTCAGAGSPCVASTKLVSTDQGGQLAGTEAILPSISTTGRFVAFLAVTANASSSAATAPNSGLRQVFVRDTCLTTPDCTVSTTRISLLPGDAPAAYAKPAGPAIAGSGKQVALADGKGSTLFTPTVTVDDHVFLAIPNPSR